MEWSWDAAFTASEKAVNEYQPPAKQPAKEERPDCPICVAPLTVKNTVTTPCNHKYHTKCLAVWINTNLFKYLDDPQHHANMTFTCPCCRHSLPNSFIKSTFERDAPNFAKRFETITEQKSMGFITITSPFFMSGIAFPRQNRFPGISDIQFLEQLKATVDMALQEARILRESVDIKDYNRATEFDDIDLNLNCFQSRYELLNQYT